MTTQQQIEQVITEAYPLQHFDVRVTKAVISIRCDRPYMVYAASVEPKVQYYGYSNAYAIKVFDRLQQFLRPIVKRFFDTNEPV